MLRVADRPLDAAPGQTRLHREALELLARPRNEMLEHRPATGVDDQLVGQTRITVRAKSALKLDIIVATQALDDIPLVVSQQQFLIHRSLLEPNAMTAVNLDYTLWRRLAHGLKSQRHNESDLFG